MSMKDRKRPDPNKVHPIAGYDKEIYVKPTIKNPRLIFWKRWKYKQPGTVTPISSFSICHCNRRIRPGNALLRVFSGFL